MMRYQGDDMRRTGEFGLVAEERGEKNKAERVRRGGKDDTADSGGNQN